MARRNYVKITHGSINENNGDRSFIIGFYKADGTLEDILETEFEYISNGDNQKIQRWIYAGVSPTEDEILAEKIELATGRIQDGKHYRSFAAPK